MASVLTHQGGNKLSGTAKNYDMTDQFDFMNVWSVSEHIISKRKI